MKVFKSKLGFTLVELIIVVAIAAVVLTPFGMMMTSGLRNEVKVQRTIDADQSTQLMMIGLNEKIRAEGFNAMIILDNHHGLTNVLRVDELIYFVNEKGYVTQTYDNHQLLPATEHIINPYVLSANHQLLNLRDDLSSDDQKHYSEKQLNEHIRLEITFSIDTDNDHVENNAYTFKYAKRK